MNIAVILLAGSSTRFASTSPKQFFEVEGHPLCYYSIKPFIESKSINKIIIVSKAEYKIRIQNMFPSLDSRVEFVIGGETRFDSVSNAVEHLLKKCDDNDNVLVHDGARLFLQENQIQDLISALDSHDAATLAIPAEDTIGEVFDGKLRNVPDRAKLYHIQTPQSFKLRLLRLLHKNKTVENPTDDAQLCLTLGKDVAILPGSKKLNKVTTIEDIDLVKVNLKNDQI